MTNNDAFALFLDLTVNGDDMGPIAYDRMKRFVHDAMARGEWLDEFDRAATEQELSGEDYRVLRNALQQAFPDAHRQYAQTISALEQHLSFPFQPIQYLIEDAASIVAANSHAVARIRDGQLIWITPCASSDGVSLHSIRDGVIEGKSCRPWGGDPDTWQPLRIALEDGRILPENAIG